MNFLFYKMKHIVLHQVFFNDVQDKISENQPTELT